MRAPIGFVEMTLAMGCVPTGQWWVDGDDQFCYNRCNSWQGLVHNVVGWFVWGLVHGATFWFMQCSTYNTCKVPLATQIDLMPNALPTQLGHR
jgi:hypothetical protein